MRKIFIGFIWLYQHTISPDKGVLKFFLKGKVCGHTPHCSEYGKICFSRYNFFQAFDFTLSRVMSCRGQIKYDPPFYKVVFFSSAKIGIPFLERLNSDKRFEVVGVVTTPDKPVGRGMKLTPSSIKDFCFKSGINNIVQTPEKIRGNKEFKNWLKDLSPDFLVVISYGKILPKDILEIPKFGPINVHGSLLPKYRGASPVQSVFLNGEKETGITIMLMNEKMDEGDIISQLKVEIPFDWTAIELINWMEQNGPDFLTDSMWKFAKDELRSYPQDEKLATYCKKIVKKDGEISPFDENLGSIYRKYRAFVLRPKIFFEYNSKHFIITKLVLDSNFFDTAKSQPLFLLRNGKLELNKAVKNIKIKPEGKKEMDFTSRKNGYWKI